MKTSDVFRLTRDRVGTLDASVAVLLTDAQLLTRLADTVRYYTVQQVGEFQTHTVDVEAFDIDDAVVPEFPDTLGTICAYHMSYHILTKTYRERLQRGEFGTVWRSGLEEESTATAAKHYQEHLNRLFTELREVLLVYHRETQGARIY